MLTLADGFLIDLEGTVFRGEQLIEGADQTITELKSFHKRILFVSNRVDLSRKGYMAKLRNLGIQVEEHEILLSSTVVAQFLKRHYPMHKVWTLSDSGLREELAAHRLSISEIPDEANWVIISLQEKLSCSDLSPIFQSVKSETRIIAIIGDHMYPDGNENFINDASIIEAIEASSGHRVDVFVVSKSSYLMRDAALDLVGIQPERCVIIGDSLESDIQLGVSYGMKTMLVLSGKTSRERLARSKLKPDYVFESIVGIKGVFK